MLAWLAFLVSTALAGIDVNAADAATLEGLPGIGPSKAAAIIAYRDQNGPFKSLDDLDRVEGIGPSTLANLRELVSFGGAVASSPAATSAGGPPAAPSPASASAGCPVNINKADAAALESMPGIGASKAAAIVQFRTDNGAFASCDGLDSVSGIGTATIEGLRSCCVTQ